MNIRNFLINNNSNKSNSSFDNNLFYKRETILKNKPLKITLSYAVFGVIWILFSDRFVQSLSLNSEVTTVISIAKGWIYVAITAILVFSLLLRLFSQINKLFDNLMESYQDKEAIEEELRANFEELKDKEKLLSESLERYDLALECSNDIIWEWDVKSDVFYIPKKAEEFIKLKNNETFGLQQYIKEYVHSDDRTMFIKDIKDHLEGKTDFYNCEYRFKKNDEQYIWVLTKGRALRDENGNLIRILGSLRDVTDRKIHEERLYEIAHYDALTGLINRKLFNEEVENHIKKKETFSIMFLDLDDFKKVNDIFGHDFGDELLIHVASLLKIEIGENNIVARVGGDEFLILLNNVNARDEIISICNKIINLFKNPLNIEGKLISISASSGIVMYPNDGNSANTLIKRADTAMYKAKASGKNNYCFFDNAMSEEIIRRAEVEKNLKNSVLDKEFEINFQPQYNVVIDRIVGVEALIRWNNPQLGRVSPAEFIPIAEESGSIEKIGAWILRKVCEQCNKWEIMNYNFGKVSVNISVVQLQQKDFLSNVKKIIEETQIKPKYLKFEITESVVITNFSNNNEVLKSLMAMGIEIALDDFGTGYSSINYLRKLPINTLKIDKSFVDNIEESKIDKAILKVMINLALEIDIEVIVEGVESKEQLDILKEIGCTQIQGYYFSKPLPLWELEGLLIRSAS